MEECAATPGGHHINAPNPSRFKGEVPQMSKSTDNSRSVPINAANAPNPSRFQGEVPQMPKSTDNSRSVPINGSSVEQQQQQQIAFLLVQLYSVFYICTKISKVMRKTVLIVAVPNIFALHIKCWWLLVSLIVYGLYRLWMYIYFLNEVLSKIENMTTVFESSL
jgi:hypothetical protein